VAVSPTAGARKHWQSAWPLIPNFDDEPKALPPHYNANT
jgi:hypothetical protein